MKRSDPRILPSEITPPEVYFNRRKLIASGFAGAALAGAGSLSHVLAAVAPEGNFKAPRNKAMSIPDAPNSFEE